MPEYVYRLHEAALLGELRRAGRDEARVRELVRHPAGKHLGGEFSWQGLAAETSIGSHSTVRCYVEDLERTFVWHIWHRVKSANRAAARSRGRRHRGFATTARLEGEREHRGYPRSIPGGRFRSRIDVVCGAGGVGRKGGSWQRKNAEWCQKALAALIPRRFQRDSGSRVSSFRSCRA